MDTKSEEKKNKSFFKSLFFEILLPGIIINAVCFFFHFAVAKADSIASELPYIVNAGPYALSTSELLNIQDTLSHFGASIDWNNDSVVIFKLYESVWYDYSHYVEVPCYRVYVLDYSGNNSASVTGVESEWISGQNFGNFVLYDSNYYIDCSFVGSSYLLRARNVGTTYNGFDYQETLNTNFNVRLFGSYSPIDVNNAFFQGSYNANYPVYINKTVSTTNVNNFETGPILRNGVPSHIIDLPGISEIEQKIWEEYVNPNDPSNIPGYNPNLSEGQNFNDTISGFWANLYSYLNDQYAQQSDKIDELGDSILAGLNKVIENIYNGFKNANDNLKEFFEPLLNDIKEAVETMAEILEMIRDPFDAELLETSLENSSFVSSVSTTFTNVSSFGSALTQTSEPDNFVLTMDFTDCFYNLGVCSLDFGIIKPFRPLIRLFIGALLIYGLVVTLFTSFDTIIGGQKND